MKKYSVQINIGLLMLLTVILLLAAGYLSYRNISVIVSSIHVDEKPELRLLTIREISMDIEKAENSISIFRITNDTSDLKPYYRIISEIDGKIKRLRFESKNDSVLLQQIEIISRLISANILNWNELLYLIQENSVNEPLKELADQLSAVTDSSMEEDRGIIKKLFTRSDRSRMDEKEIISKLQEIGQQDELAKEKLMVKESQVAATSMKIKEQLYDLISRMENEVALLIRNKAADAGLMAQRTFNWLVMFSVSGMLLALLVMLIIIRYVRKTHAYQVALEHSKEEAEELARTKEMFIANMSHEIRTPLTAISGFSEQLLNESQNEKRADILKIIKSSSDHLAKVINNILDFSKLQNEKSELEKVHFLINQLLEDIYVMFDKEAGRNNNLLTYSVGPDTPPVLVGDPYRLKQILINLLSNSIKFTENGKIHFSANRIVKENLEDELVLEVTDSGIGIEESKLNVIFEDFAQGETNTARRYGGTGLGLSIVKKIVELHKGSISCKSRKGEGTIITVHLPCQIGDEKLVLKDTSERLVIPDEVRKLKILVVDDEKYNRLLFKKILESWQSDFHEAENGMKAIDMLRSGNYDLLIMDLRMPGMDGLQATEIIRREMKIKEQEMPVIFVSAALPEADIEKYKQAGMSAFIQKPFTEEKLLNTIISVLKNEKAGRVNGHFIEQESEIPRKVRINLQNLVHLAGSDREFFKQMITTYIETTENGLNEMQQAIISGEIETAAYLVHKMLPPSRHIGAADLLNLLLTIEDGIHKGMHHAYLENLTLEILEEFKLVRRYLQEEISRIY